MLLSLIAYNGWSLDNLALCYADMLWTVILLNAYLTRHSLISLQDDDKEFKINWRRVATTSLFGFGFVGPVGHFWLVFSVNRLPTYCCNY